jgi:hypothetical protein
MSFEQHGAERFREVVKGQILSRTFDCWVQGLVRLHLHPCLRSRHPTLLVLLRQVTEEESAVSFCRLRV